MNPEILWWLDNISSGGENVEITQEAISAAMEQSRKGAQAWYRTRSNQAINNQIADFLWYIYEDSRSDKIFKCINVFNEWPNRILFGELAVFLAPFFAQDADKFHINQIYNINYHISNKKSEYIYYINKLIDGSYKVSDVIKTEEIDTIDELKFGNLNKNELFFWADEMIKLFAWQNDEALDMKD